METLAAIYGDQLVSVIIQLIIGAIICWVLWWGLGKIGLPEPFNKVITVLLVLLIVVFVVNALLSLTGHPLIRW